MKKIKLVSIINKRKCLAKLLFLSALLVGYFLTRELRACARASYRYDVGNAIRSLARSLARLVDSCKLFLDFRLLSAFDSFWRAINRRNGDLCC